MLGLHVDRKSLYWSPGKFSVRPVALRPYGCLRGKASGTDLDLAQPSYRKICSEGHAYTHTHIHSIRSLALPKSNLPEHNNG